MLPLRQSAARVAARVALPATRIGSRPCLLAMGALPTQRPMRSFQSSATLQAVQSYILADIGEGITECQIVEWLVKPGDQVEQFDPICEVQSDKASVEITSRYEGRIEKLHYDVGEMAIVGQPLLEIDVKEGEEEEDDVATPAAAAPEEAKKEAPPPAPATASPAAASSSSTAAALAEDTIMPMTPIQQQMFQTMTRALAIPHFLFTHKVNLTPLMALRQRLNDAAAAAAAGPDARVSVLPFVLKALSDAAVHFPAVNAVVDSASSQVTLKAAHNFGIAIDTPKGLVVPVVRNVQNHSIRSLGAEIARLGKLARDGRLRPHDLQGASLVVSNIGSIGGSTVAPVILPPMTAIVAVGAVEAVPAFEVDAQGQETIVKQQQVVLSWSADHRVLDGATVARCAKEVAEWLEGVEESKIQVD